MTCDFIKADNMEVVNAWHKHHGQGEMPFEALPPNAFIVYDGTMPIASGAVYMTDSPLCYMEAVVSNPVATLEQRRAAVGILFDNMVGAARFNGRKWWAATSKEIAMGEWAKKYKVTQSGEGYYWFTGET